MSAECATAVILAAGKGVRFKSALPKVMHELAGRPLLAYVLRAARGAGIRNVIVVVGAGHEHVVKAFKKEGVRFALQKKQLGTAHAARVGCSLSGKRQGPVAVLSGDAPLVTSRTIRRAIARHKKESAACTVITAVLDSPAGYGRIVRSAGGGIERIVEEKDASADEKKIQEVNSGSYVFDGASLRKALARVGRSNKQKEYYLTDCIEILRKEGKKVSAFVADDASEVLGVNSRRELAAVEKIYRRRILERHLEAGVSIIDPENTCIDDTVRIGRDTIIYPFTVIAGNVRIGRGARIGPFSFVRDGSVIADGAQIGAFAEVKNSKIGRNSRASHFCYIGDATVGKDVTIGAGAVTANFDGRRTYKTRIGDGALIGGGSVLIAPVKIGKGARTGGGAVVTKGRDVKAGQTVAGVPARGIKKGSVHGG